MCFDAWLTEELDQLLLNVFFLSFSLATAADQCILSPAVRIQYLGG